MLQRACIAAAVCLTAIALTVGHLGTATGKLRLGVILDRTAQADTLHLQLQRADAAIDVWVAAGNRVRWEQTPTRYEIARGSRLWRVDEEANTVQRDENPWLERGRIDLLAMLGLDDGVTSMFRQAVADGVVEHAGRRCDVYRMMAERDGTPIYLEAYVSRQTRELQTIAAWSGEQRRGRPLAELTLVAKNLPIAKTKFVVAQSLREDGRLGKIVDAQGVVTLRPPLQRRWTPVRREMLVKPGDWLRTDVRGANAATVELTANVRVIAGPGSLVEFQGANKVVLHGGELKVVASKGAEDALEIVGPRNQQRTVAAGESLHVAMDRGEKLREVAKKPLWLAGYEGSSNQDSLGSLVARIDGRDIPLTVGFHRVSVDIRDQIARTTIEQSFDNHTKNRLEGTFYFPLPQDASISGFGMWIGDELVEADVVEKQRAREIYEQILREKRDPGLLEWTGGNIFKARVFPIEAHSEKRIRIVYTQVLPLRANQYRYSYGLRSELLQKTPVRELAIRVNVHSTLPLRSVKCGTHSTRDQVAEHSAEVEFSAQEYTPDRDFEVVCEVDAAQSDVVVIPHRRGDDGYFMVQLTPPGRQGNWQRDLLPDGQPLDLLLVCDTSASMDSQKRQQQAEFVRSVLTSLGPEDQFNLAACDVDCHWLFDESQASDQASVAKALDWLDARVSLGWTDLDAMAGSLLQRAGKQTHAIYVGDAMVSAHGADPVGFANRLQRLTGDGEHGTFHAVGVGSSFESVVLKSIARVGGGSVRQIGGERTPPEIAFELLNEIAQPGIRDLRVEIRGIQVAAIYPDQLPNLAAGTQHILIGRYLPEGEQQSGEIVIRGTRNGEPVQYSSRIELENAETGNSFIPRLWARAHLDHLLAQGNSPLIQDEIIALSERFHIITPYTSLLVLETDEDRERFGVKRRFLMRDGERFFAEGKNQATYELLQQQMKRAGQWRLGLRRQILADLLRLGRNQAQLQAVEQEISRRTRGTYFDSRVAGAAGYSMPDAFGSDLFVVDGSFGVGGLGGGGFGGGGGYGGADGFAAPGYADEAFSLDALTEVNSPFPLQLQQQVSGERSSFDFDGLESLEAANDFGAAFNKRVSDFQSNHPALPGMPMSGVLGPPSSGGVVFGGGAFSHHLDFGRVASDSTAWLQAMLPPLPTPPLRSDVDMPEWPADVLQLARRLVVPPNLREQALRIDVTVTPFQPAWDRQLPSSQTFQLVAEEKWLERTTAVGSPTITQWYAANLRAAVNEAFQLGRSRAGHDSDANSLVPGRRGYADTGIHQSFIGYQARLERIDDDRQRIILTADDTTLRISVNTERRVVEMQQWLSGDKITSTTDYKDFVQVADVWWPQRIEDRDGQGRLTSVTTQSVKAMDAKPFEDLFAKTVPQATRALIFHEPLPTLRQAEAAQASGKEDLGDLLSLMNGELRIQQWDDARNVFDRLAERAGDRPAIGWLRVALQANSRQREQAHGGYRRLIEALIAAESTDDLYLAEYAMGQLNAIAEHNEMLRLLDDAKPIYSRQEDAAAALRSWTTQRAHHLRTLGRQEEAAELQRKLATDAPWDVPAQIEYARDLLSLGEVEEAYKWLEREMARPQRLPHETSQLRDHFIRTLKERGEAQRYVELMRQWVETNPDDDRPYAEYLAALIFADQVDEADEQARQWLAAGRIDDKLSGALLARVRAASAYARGQRYGMYTNWVHPRWLPVLEETGRYFLTHDHDVRLGVEILNAYRFSRTDAADRLREVAASRLREQVETLSAEHVLQLVNASSGSTLTDEQWKALAATIHDRWRAIDDQDKDNHDQLDALATALENIYQRFDREQFLLPLLRERIARQREMTLERWSLVGVKQSLYNRLIQRPWKSHLEKEALYLLEELSANATEASQLTAQIATLHTFIDAMLKSRFDQAMQDYQDQHHPEELTRTELAKLRAKFQEEARRGLVALLNERIENGPRVDRAEEIEQEYLGWLYLERMYLQLRLGENRNGVARYCWSVVGESPEENDGVSDRDSHAAIATLQEADAERLRQLRAQRRSRAFAMLSYLAVRKSASDKLVHRVLDYVSAGTEFSSNSDAWKKMKFQLLIALDRPDEIVRDLKKWIREDAYVAPYQRWLAQLQAERGLIAEAVTLIEAAGKATQLTPDDYAALSNWYLVLDRQDEHRRAKIEVFKARPEYQIRNYISQKRRPWYASDAPLPTELEEEVLFAFQALFEKSNNPQNYLHDLREFYQACRDFRLLHVIPDSLIGRTPQQVYPVLSRVHATVLSEVRDEAVVDSILQRIAVRRANLPAESTSGIDRRALDLLEAIVLRKASEVEDQSQVHVEAAVAALQRAFEHDWADGEVRQMAMLLESLGNIGRRELNAERLRQLQTLQTMTEEGTEDHLYVSLYLGRAYFYSHSEHERGISVVSAALQAYREDHSTSWPPAGNTALSDYISMLEGRSRFAAGEELLTEIFNLPSNTSQRLWLAARRNRLYVSALKSEGQVSLGSRQELYRNLLTRLIDEATESTSDAERKELIRMIMDVLDIAQDKLYGNYAIDTRQFVGEQLPRLLQRQVNNYYNTIDYVSDRVNHILGPRDALKFLIERYEQYPARFDGTYESAWNRLAYRLGRFHQALDEKAGDLEPRLLKIVTDELRRTLLIQNAENRYFYHKNRTNFWRAKVDDFAGVAEEVVAEHPQDPRLITYTAEYLFYGIDRHDRAIEIMQKAYDKDLLSYYQVVSLCDLLHARNRHAESVAMLQDIVEQHPNEISFRTRLLTAYHRSGRKDQLKELLAATDKHFRQRGRWNLSAISALASNCYSNELYREAVDYYGELIPLYRRSARNGGIGDHTLSNYYATLARALTRLNRTEEAVNAASAGVIVWGHRDHQRKNSLNTLKFVLSEAQDLDAYVARRDKQVAATNQDSPLIRHYIGIAFVERKQHDKAIAQFRIALQLQPTNLEVHQQLIAAFDAANRRSEAIEQTLAMLDVDRHNLTAFVDLAKRLREDEALSERAATTLIEASPNEAENHQALAEWRQQQNRWKDAAQHWQRVAELRSLEPTGLLRLAAAQIKIDDLAGAKRSIETLRNTSWPPRFGNVTNEIRELESRLADVGRGE